ncbi:MAG: T9SS type A sorting domain-containing protein, partial [Flavisolibacter sp.]
WQYYRLRQVDVDGGSTYSPVVRIFYKHKHIIKRFGNPVSDVLQMELEFTAGTNAMLQIYDMNGRQVKTEKLKAGPVSVDMSRLSNGVYLVEVSTPTETEKIRIVKQ